MLNAHYSFLWLKIESAACTTATASIPIFGTVLQGEVEVVERISAFRLNLVYGALLSRTA